MIPEDKIAEIRAAARISDFITPHVSLKRRGKALLGLCPFHNEKTPSFSVNDDRGFYHCFGCSAGGNVFKFLMELEQLTFPEAVNKVAERYGIDVPQSDGRVEKRDPSFFEINASAARYYQRFLLESEHAEPYRSYLEGRGLTSETIETFTIGAASPSGNGLVAWFAREGVDLRKAAHLGLVSDRGGRAYDRFRGRVMFPIRDSQGRVIGFGGRLVGDAEGPKYLNSPESEVYKKSRALYGVYEARETLRDGDLIILVEGYMDVIALRQAGIRNVVATCGTALTPEQARVIRRYAPEVVTLFDGDEAGGRAAARSFPIFVEAGIWPRGLALPDGEDPDSFVSAKGAECLQGLVKTAVPLADAYIKQTTGDAEPGSPAVARAGRELAGLLARVKDPFEHDVLVKKAALWTGISETVLRREASRAERRMPPEPEGPGTENPRRQATARPRAAGPEELLATVLLADPDLAVAAADRGVVDSMEEGLWKNVTNVIISACRVAGSVDVSEVMEEIPTAERERVASSLNEDALGERSQRERILEDCIRGIDRNARKRHNRSVLAELRKTEQLGSEEVSKEKLEQWRPRTSSDA